MNVLEFKGYIESLPKETEGETGYYSGHTHAGSAYESASDCGTCSGAKCEYCHWVDGNDVEGTRPSTEKVAEFIWNVIQAKRGQGRAIFEKLDVATIDELKEELETDVFVPDDFWANIWKEDIADINLHIMYTQFRWYF